jgi:hypothetical protein
LAKQVQRRRFKKICVEIKAFSQAILVSDRPVLKNLLI